MDPLSADWATGVFLCCLLILATVNMGSPRKWRALRQGALRLRQGRQALREEVDARDRNLAGLLAVAVAAIAMVLWQAAALSGDALRAPAYAHMFIGVALVLAGQAALLRVVAFLAETDRGIIEYLYAGTLLHAATGIGLLPVAIMAAYRPEWRGALVPVGLALLGAGLLYRWLRGAWIGLGEGVPMRYVLLYLCAAEITPLALALGALRGSPAHLP